MTRIVKSAVFGLLLSVPFSAAHAAIRTAASCNASDVQTAMNSAVAGDTVAIPAGTCAWTTQVSWAAPANAILQGAGDASLGGGDHTVIIDNYASNRTLLSIATDPSGTFRMTGITFQGGNGLIKYNGLVGVGGSSHQIRVDHVHVNMQTYSPSNNGDMIFFTGWLYGVVDHSLFDLSGVGNGLPVWYETYNGTSEGDGAFADDTGLGTNTFLFVENNTFNSPTQYGTGNDCSHGGKWVWRFNTMHTTSVQTHPTGGSGRGRGCRAWEVYQNTFDGPNSNPNFNAMFLSSGTGVIWGNTASSGFSNFVTLHSMRKNNNTYPESAPPNGWGYCGTAFNGTGSNWDQNTVASTGYACLDQPGRGKGDLLQGDFPNACDVTSGGCAAHIYTGTWPHEALEPVFEWKNTWACSGCGGSYWSVYEPTVLLTNQDYYLYTSSFNGTSGTGSGTLASRPSTCTTGVAYWATDQGAWNQSGSGGQGELFVCSATNRWSPYYTPYTYPHPLTQGGGHPAPPTNLHATPS